MTPISCFPASFHEIHSVSSPTGVIACIPFRYFEAYRKFYLSESLSEDRHTLSQRVIFYLTLEEVDTFSLLSIDIPAVISLFLTGKNFKPDPLYDLSLNTFIRFFVVPEHLDEEVFRTFLTLSENPVIAVSCLTVGFLKRLNSTAGAQTTGYFLNEEHLSVCFDGVPVSLSESCERCHLPVNGCSSNILTFLMFHPADGLENAVRRASMMCELIRNGIKME